MALRPLCFPAVTRLNFAPQRDCVFFVALQVLACPVQTLRISSDYTPALPGQYFVAGSSEGFVCTRPDSSEACNDSAV